MRSIKFRAWNIDRKRLISASTKKFSIVNDNDLLDEELKQHGYTLEQYTGLKDKTGKEIYEGDILLIVDVARKKGIKRPVVFYDGCFCYSETQEGDSFLCGVASDEKHSGSHYCKIIGNIHDGITDNKYKK